MSYVYQAGPWSPNYSTGNDVCGIVIHHAAGTSFDAIGNTFQNAARQASAHYGVMPGKVAQYVDEKNCAWHAADYWANTHTIGIENVNTGGDEQGWPIAEETIQTCCELMADIAVRHNLYPLKRNVNVWGHRDFAATLCPGVLYDRLDEMCTRANSIIEGKGDVKVDTAEEEFINEVLTKGNKMTCIFWYKGAGFFLDAGVIHPLSSINQCRVIEAFYKKAYGEDIKQVTLADQNWFNVLNSIYETKK